MERSEESESYPPERFWRLLMSERADSLSKKYLVCLSGVTIVMETRVIDVDPVSVPRCRADSKESDFAANFPRKAESTTCKLTS